MPTDGIIKPEITIKVVGVGGGGGNAVNTKAIIGGFADQEGQKQENCTKKDGAKIAVGKEALRPDLNLAEADALQNGDESCDDSQA